MVKNLLLSLRPGSEKVNERDEEKRRKKEEFWKKNLVLKNLLLSLRPGSEKVNERDRVWEEKMKSVERKIWCEKSSSYLCSPLKKRAKSSSIKNVYHAENFWKFLEEKFGRNKKALTFATPIKRGGKIKPKDLWKIESNSNRLLKIGTGNVSVTN